MREDKKYDEDKKGEDSKTINSITNQRPRALTAVSQPKVQKSNFDSYNFSDSRSSRLP